MPSTDVQEVSVRLSAGLDFSRVLQLANAFRLVQTPILSAGLIVSVSVKDPSHCSTE